MECTDATILIVQRIPKMITFEQVLSFNSKRNVFSPDGYWNIELFVVVWYMSMFEIKFVWDNMTPFGKPVVPLEYGRTAKSSVEV